MRSVVQRVRRAEVRVDGQAIGSIGPGLLVLVGVGRADDGGDVDWMAGKLAGLRIFQDGEGKMNRSVEDMGGALLLVSQFTLHGDCRKGRRPSFNRARHPDEASPLFDALVASLRARGLPVETGAFGAMMDVELVNDGPVTLIVESPSEGR